MILPLVDGGPIDLWHTVAPPKERGHPSGGDYMESQDYHHNVGKIAPPRRDNRVRGFGGPRG